ncbi:MAG: DUF349 domain-containing protein [Sulfuritalea sp.]|jgi:hypothetical protein|nr:DUF349 domain-containing protein [Sulfuritalea sp.]
MNWVRQKLFGSAAKPDNPPSKQRIVKSSSTGSATPLRRAMIVAASETERAQAAKALGRTLAELLENPQAEDPPEVLVSAICHVADKTLARSWMERLEGEVWLGEVAIHGNSSEVRLAAARRVQDTTILERIVEGSRNKDKSAYRHCSELLHQRRQSSKRALRAVELGADLRVLLDRVPISLSRLLELEKELGSPGTGEPSPAENEARTLLEQARTRLKAESLIRQELTTSLAAAKVLCNECSGEAWPEPPQREYWRIRLEALSSLQTRLPAWLAQNSSAHELAKSVSGMADRLNSLAADSEHLLVCEQFLAAPGADGGQTETLKEAWAALPKPGHPAARMALESAWKNLLASQPEVVEPTSPSKLPKTVNSAAVAKFLDQLENKVTQGNLADADAVHKELTAVLAGTTLHGAAESRLRHINAEMSKLRGWARWSNGQAREQLIAKAEELLTGSNSVSDLTQKIPALREEWKLIDTYGPATKDHWGRFDSALTTAYQPVAAHRAEVAAQHAEARAAQDALCTARETEFMAIAWEQADYRQIEARRGDMLKQWRALTKPGSRRNQGLHKRFDALIGDIDRRLTAVRTVEVERCENLISAAQKLQELSDGARATTQVKHLQEQWSQQRSALRLDRRDEQKLWQRFRAACDVVFANRDAQRARQTAQREEHVQARQELLNALAASMTGTDIKGIRHALNQVLSDAASAENFRGGIDPLKKRAHDLTLEAKRRIETLLRNDCRAHHELLAKKAALAQQVEAAAFTPTATELVAAAKQAWEDLPKLPAKAEAMLSARFAKAADATPEMLPAGRDVRDALLLDLEIALGLPSPETSVENRRKRQLEKLQKRFGGDARPAVDTATSVVAWHATAAMPDAGLDERMAAVLSKLEDLAAVDL